MLMASEMHKHSLWAFTTLLSSTRDENRSNKIFRKISQLTLHPLILCLSLATNWGPTHSQLVQALPAYWYSSVLPLC